MGRDAMTLCLGPAQHPAHVPEELVRPFTIDFRGPAEDLFPRLEALRDEGRVLWVQTGLFGDETGAWLLTHADDICHALLHPDEFSSQLGRQDASTAMIPTFLDPPEHARYRRLLDPIFSPSAIGAMEAGIRDHVRDLVGRLADQGSCDFVADVATPLPARVFCSWMGLPEGDTETFVAFASSLIHGSEDRGEREVITVRVFAALGELITARIAAPTADVMSQIVQQQVDGRPLTTDELFRICFLLFVEGLDTLTAALSVMFWHLGRSGEYQRALASGELPAVHAVDEMLRRQALANLPRMVTHGTSVAGVELRAGDPVVLPLPLVSQCAARHEVPSAVGFDSSDARHHAFGLGIHRCPASQLALLELRVALEEWHARIPAYHVADGVEAYAGRVMGITNLPLAWP
jgi:cytochrome P450